MLEFIHSVMLTGQYFNVGESNVSYLTFIHTGVYAVCIFICPLVPSSTNVRTYYIQL